MLLFDQNISFRITKKLKNEFLGCVHVSDCSLSNSDDVNIWQYAKEHNLAIVTFDADFYDISIINGHPPKIIWIRTGNLSTKEIANLLTNNEKAIKLFLYEDEFKDVACLELQL